MNSMITSESFELTSEQAKCLTFLNQSTWARQWSKACINSCATTRFIWDWWRMLFWHRTICRRRDTGSFFIKIVPPCPITIHLGKTLISLLLECSVLTISSSVPTWEVAESKPPLTQPSQFSQEKCRSLKTVLKGTKFEKNLRKPANPLQWRCNYTERDEVVYIPARLLHGRNKQLSIRI